MPKTKEQLWREMDAHFAEAWKLRQEEANDVEQLKQVHDKIFIKLAEIQNVCQQLRELATR